VVSVKDIIDRLLILRGAIPLKENETELFQVELANKIRGGRAVGNLYGVARFIEHCESIPLAVRRRRHTYVLTPQTDEELARFVCTTLNLPS
jgi:hypothetical protein